MERHTLLSTLKNIDNKLLDLTKQVMTKTLLFGSNSFDINTNTNFLNVTVSLVYLLKDLTNCFSMKLLIVVKTKLSIQNWANHICSTSNTIIILNLFLAYFSYVLWYLSFIPRDLVYFGTWWLSVLLLQCRRFIWVIYKKMSH